MVNKQSQKAKAGRKGGNETLRKHGRVHYVKIGKMGAKVFHDRYVFQPFGQYDFAIVRREDNQIVTFLFGA